MNAVDWNEPIQFDNPCSKHLELEFIGDVYSFGNEHFKNIVAVKNKTTGNVVLRRKNDGTSVDEMGSAIINVPKPVKKVTVGVAYYYVNSNHKPEYKRMYPILLHDDGRFQIDCHYYKSLEEAGPNGNGGWHILIEPREVELPQ